MFFINNSIDWDWFHQLYNLYWINKGIRNAKAIACKVGPALRKTTDHRLEVASEESQKRKQMVEKQKTASMAAKRQRVKGRISLPGKEEKDYNSNIWDKMDQNQAHDE